MPANHARTPRHSLEADHKNHITRTGLGGLSGQCPQDQSFFESETMSRRTFISSLRSRSQRECDTRMTNCIGREIDICKTVPCIRRGRPYRSNQLFPDDRSRSFLPRFCAKPWGGRGNPIATSLILSANARYSMVESIQNHVEQGTEIEMNETPDPFKSPPHLGAAITKPFGQTSPKLWPGRS